jgi:hypothetical protein
MKCRPDYDLICDPDWVQVSDLICDLAFGLGSGKCFKCMLIYVLICDLVNNPVCVLECDLAFCL